MKAVRLLEVVGSTLVLAATTVSTIIAIVAGGAAVVSFTRHVEHWVVTDIMHRRKQLALAMLMASAVLYCEVGRQHMTHLVVTLLTFVIIPLTRWRTRRRNRNRAVPFTRGRLEGEPETRWEVIFPVVVCTFEDGTVSAAGPRNDEQWQFMESAARYFVAVTEDPFVTRA